MEPLPLVAEVVTEKIDSGELASIAETKATIAVEAIIAHPEQMFTPVPLIDLFNAD